MNGNSHQALDCDYCALVYYSKGALTNHMKKEHWDDWYEDNNQEEPEE